MTPERWKQIDELLEAALELPVTDRASFLDRACAGDPDLRRELESLLASDRQADTFIESPPGGVAADLLADTQPKPGKGDRIAHYDIVALLGAGGMGEVYLARDTRLGRKVALKLLPPALTSDPHLRARFVREAQLASALDHPNICTIHEVGQSFRFLYLAMQYIEGSTLTQLIGARPLKLDALLSISFQAADALAAAHEQGIVHRDIKSDNIIVTPRGQVKVLDFGLAKLVDGSVRKHGIIEQESAQKLTSTGMVMGTPCYMSPEQARGERADHRSDIYSLGVVIYEMATGEVPFKRPSRAETMSAVINEPHAPVTNVNKNIPSGLSAAIDRALSKTPAHRYQSIGEMLQDLREVGRSVGFLGSGDSKDAVIPYVPLRKRTATPWIWATALLALLMLGLGLWFYSRQSLGRSSVSAGEIKSLAVLPLENLSGDDAQEYLADGMTDALIGELAKIGALRVIPRTSAMHYKETEKTLQEIAGELKVDGVVEGTVTRSGDRVGIRAQLIHAASQRHLWVKSYERDLRDVLALESEIAQAIAREIKISVTPQDQARLDAVRPVNADAFQLYLKGRYFWNKRSEEGLRKGIEFFNQAIEKDPGYALPHAGLADSYNFLGAFGIAIVPPQEAMPKAKAAATSALRLDENLAEAHTSLAFVRLYYDWDWAEAQKEFERALELNPSYPQSHQWYSHYLMALGQNEKSLTNAKRAVELDPLSLPASMNLGWQFHWARQYDPAIEQSLKTVELGPGFAQGHWGLGLAYEQKGKYEEAIGEFQRASSLSNSNDPVVLAAIGHAYAVSGKTAAAIKKIEELMRLAKQKYVAPYWVATLYAGLGKKTQAFEWLEKAYAERSGAMIWLNVDPRLDVLRSDRRFDGLLQRVGLVR